MINRIWCWVASATLILFLIVVGIGLNEGNYAKVFIGIIGVLISLFGLVQPIKPCQVCHGLGYTNGMKCPACGGRGCI